MATSLDEAPRTRAAKSEPNKFRRFFKILGPGLISGASDDDPSGIVTYSTAGAQFGFATLWMAFFTLPLAITVQFICSKIGLVTGRGLSEVIRDFYPRKILYPTIFLLVLANTINAGTDLGAIAAAIHLLCPSIPIQLSIAPIAVAIILLLTFGSYKFIISSIKWLTLSLFAYVGTAFFVQADWGDVLRSTFIPTIKFTPEYLSMLVAILGTTISPYLFFWESQQEVEEQSNDGVPQEERKGASRDDLKYAFFDVNAGMFFSNIVMYFIIFATGATLFASGKHSIETAADAASALEPFAGEFATWLFALGVIGTGMLAVPVLVGSAAYALSSACGWRCGLSKKWFQAKEFYFCIAIATLSGMTINFLDIKPMQALYWTAIMNGILAPPLLHLIMVISSDRKIVGDKVNSRLTHFLGWCVTILMYLAAITLIVTSIPWTGKS